VGGTGYRATHDSDAHRLLSARCASPRNLVRTSPRKVQFLLLISGRNGLACAFGPPELCGSMRTALRDSQASCGSIVRPDSMETNWFGEGARSDIVNAQSKTVAGRQKTSKRDPVCGKRVATSRVALSEEYAGVTYFFCSQSCLDRFNQDADIFTIGGPTGTLAGAQATHDRGQRTTSQVPNYAGHLLFETPSVDAGPG
jgi:YHS domain-containing protein